MSGTLAAIGRAGLMDTVGKGIQVAKAIRDMPREDEAWQIEKEKTGLQMQGMRQQQAIQGEALARYQKEEEERNKPINMPEILRGNFGIPEQFMPQLQAFGKLYGIDIEGSIPAYKAAEFGNKLLAGKEWNPISAGIVQHWKGIEDTHYNKLKTMSTTDPKYADIAKQWNEARTFRAMHERMNTQAQVYRDRVENERKQGEESEKNYDSRFNPVDNLPSYPDSGTSSDLLEGE